MHKVKGREENTQRCIHKICAGGQQGGIRVKRNRQHTHYTYSANGSLISMSPNGTDYYYIKNRQGDIIVIGLCDSLGMQVASYTYDTKGNFMKYDKSNLKYYLFFWIIMLICYIFIYYSIISSIMVFISYVVISWIFDMVVNTYESRRIISYVKDNYNDEYIKMKSINGKEGVHNGFTTLAFIFSDKYQEDDILSKLKEGYKKVILL
jgi:hypothetical protein